MKSYRLSALSMLLPICMATSVTASGPATTPATTGSSESAGLSQRSELVYKIVSKWGVHVQEAYRADVHRWARKLGPLFQNASLESLKKAANARSFEAMNDALVGKASRKKASVLAPGDFETNALGDLSADLVFVPISPCRLFDTRVAGGRIAADTARSFDVTAVSDYSFQGGSASDCGGAGAAGSFAAAVINFTVVNPSFQGFLTAYPFGTTRPLASTMNYDPADILANVSIVALDQGPSASELTVYTQAPTHLIGDLVGYFITPQATTLDCLTTANVTVNVAAGATGNAFASACPFSYIETGTNCRATSFDMPLALSGGGTCSARNNSGSTSTLEASRRCCRVPGR